MWHCLLQVSSRQGHLGLSFDFFPGRHGRASLSLSIRGLLVLFRTSVLLGVLAVRRVLGTVVCCSCVLVAPLLYSLFLTFNVAPFEPHLAFDTNTTETMHEDDNDGVLWVSLRRTICRSRVFTPHLAGPSYSFRNPASEGVLKHGCSMGRAPYL